MPFPILILLGLLLSACAPTLVWHGRSADRRVRIEVLERSGRQLVSVGGRRQPGFDAIGYQQLAISADGRVVAYPAQRAGRWHLVVDGRPGPAWTAIGEVLLTPDGAHLAYAALSDDGWHVVQDGRPGPAFGAILAHSLSFGAGGRLAYAVRGREGVTVVRDGVPDPWVSAVRGLQSGYGGRRLAYVARRGRSEHVVVDGVAGPGFAEITGLAVAADAPPVVYAARQGEGSVLLRDGQERLRFAGDLVSLELSADGAHEACLAVDDDGVDLLLDGRVANHHADVEGHSLTLSRDGRHHTYVALESGGRRVFHDGQGGPVLDEVTELVALPGGRWGYIGRLGTGFQVHVDGRPAGQARGWAGGLALADQGGRFGYLIRHGRRFAVVDDEGETLLQGTPLVDTLAFDRSGQLWGCLVAHARSRRVEVFFEVGPARPFDWDEVGALITREGMRAARPGLLRGLVQAELEQ